MSVVWGSLRLSDETSNSSSKPSGVECDNSLPASYLPQFLPYSYSPAATPYRKSFPLVVQIFPGSDDNPNTTPSAAWRLDKQSASGRRGRGKLNNPRLCSRECCD